MVDPEVSPKMSNSTLPRDSSSRLREVVDQQTLRTGASLVATPVRFVGFWAAITLPFLYLPLLFVGLEGTVARAFLALVGLHAVALLVGHNYGESGSSARG